MPNSSKSEPTTIAYGRITEIRNDCVIAVFSSASQLIPTYRFIKEDDKANLYIGAKIKVNRYFSDLTRKNFIRRR